MVDFSDGKVPFFQLQRVWKAGHGFILNYCACGWHAAAAKASFTANVCLFDWVPSQSTLCQIILNSEKIQPNLMPSKIIPLG